MKVKALLSACAAATLIWTGQAGATVLLSDNFDTETQSLNYTSFTNWNVSAGSVDLIGTGFYNFYPGNGNYVDMAGSTDVGGTLASKQSFILPSGNAFNLSFSLGGSTRGDTNVVDVILAGINLATLTIDSSDPLGLHTHTLPNTTGSDLSGNLVFINRGNDSQGAILDNVLLSSDSLPVPEPGTLALLGLGFGSLMLRRRWHDPTR